MSSDLLGVSVTGLRVAQSSLSTIGHNIANAGVEGYSRQRVNAATNPTTLQGGHYVGNGANVESIERQVNEFLTKQLRDDNTLYNNLEVYYDNIRQLDSLLSDASSGLSSALETFFASVQNGADDPTSIPARQLIISESENLSDRFNTIYGRLETISDGIDTSLASAVEQVNALVSNVAQLNDKIAEAIGVSGGAAPNDLLDQRDQTLQELSKYISIQTYEQGFGKVNVVVGSGQNLVIGSDARNLDLVASEENGGEMQLVFRGEQITQTFNVSQVGGEIGGLLRFRDVGLGDTYNHLGQIALSVADNFNEMHQLGVNLHNEFGGNFFFDINEEELARDRVIAHAGNALPQDRVLRTNIVDSSVIGTSDYQIDMANGGSFTISRLSDGVEVANGLITSALPYSVEFDGLEVVFEAGSFQAGDQFLVQPTRTASRDIYAALSDPAEIAFGSPIVADASIGNSGTGAITSGEFLARTDAFGNNIGLLDNPQEMTPPLLIKFTSATTYDVLDNSDPGNPVQLDPPIRNQRYVPGMTNPIFPTDPGGTLVSTEGVMLGLPAGRSPVVGGGAVTNGYPQEVIRITRQADNPALAGVTQNVVTPLNGSAREIASILNNLEGVSANAFTYAEISNTAGLTGAAPLQINLNGEDLIEYEWDSGSASFVVASNVPSPSDEVAFNDYIADRINANTNLSRAGVFANATYDAATNTQKIEITATQGDDLAISLEADATGPDTMNVSDGSNPTVALDGNGAGVTSAIAVGGHLDVQLAEGVSLGTLPPNSMLFGNTQAADFAQANYMGIQAVLSGAPDEGDEFTLGINIDAAMDNRNALNMVDIQSSRLVDGGNSTISERYGALVEEVGINTAAAQTNRDAADRVLEQSKSLRDSISAVNLDEEAADLIRFEQLYAANTQVISVARDLFDRLIGSF